MQINQLTINKERIEDTIRLNTSTVPTLVAVTKTVDATVIRQLYQLGLKHFGENRPDVFLDKVEALETIREDIHWHYIGNLQSRQVKKIINHIDYLHSLDRLSLAAEIEKRASHPIKCFLQVNVSGEESKSGVSPHELDEMIDQLCQFDKIRVIGLMTMAPIDSTSEQLHQYFSELRQLSQKIAQRNLSKAPCTELSMGMSQDFPIALQEGATFVRIGSSFFKSIQ